MLLSMNWLKTLVDEPDAIKPFCDRLDLTGTGVEGVTTTGASFDGIYVGQILTRDRHPNADTLWLCTVDVGAANLGDDGKPAALQIVCGAQNFVAGDKVPVATIGTTMPDGTKIKKSKLRGVESFGMNCSGRELGISEDHSGLLILPSDAPVGTPFAEYYGTGDTIIDLEITPNRPDCLSMEGLAREVGAMYGIDYTPERFDIKEHLADDGAEASSLVSVEIADSELCPRYTARVVKGLAAAPSPEWLAQRVAAAGSRPISNLVDVTNYIMYSLGQPLHAFDYDRLPKGDDGKVHIGVRAAHDGEEFTTLDGKERVLTHDMAVITASDKIVALAGVMGGLETEVTDATTTVLLESATFSPGHTSRTSRNLALISESSMRYERSVDATSCLDFSEQAAALMAEVGGGEVCRGAVDVYPVEKKPIELQFRMGRFCRFIGADVPQEDAAGILVRLGCKVCDNGAKGDDGTSTLSVVAPTFRPDLEREIDLYEEVLRLWGMEKVASTLPGGRGRIGGLTVDQQRADHIGEVLRACGLNETMTYALVPADDMERLRMDGEGRGEAVEIINPMSAEQSVLRQTIIPGLLRSIAYNQSRGTQDIQLYETGAVFAAAEGRKKPKEKNLVAGVLAGSWNQQAWNEPARELGFFDAKGIVETLLHELCIKKVRFKAIEGDIAGQLQPGRAAEVMAGGSVLGWVGEIHPLALGAFDAQGPVAAFELDEAALLKAAQDHRDYEEVPRFPAVDVDLAIVVDEDVSAEKLLHAMKNAGGNLLESVRLFDVYRDDQRLGKGKKSMAFSLSYRASDRTLTGDEVEHAHERLVDKVCSATGGEVRS